ncbi:MAG TPA: hypothetical protein DDZ62_07155 [Delftia acidovorans]|nr:hypothetical protein [Delftia acidovorans]
MRPAGDVRLALVQACERIHRDTGQGAPTRELARQAGVGLKAATDTIKNLSRAGVLAKGGEQTVSYRNRPVALWIPKAAAAANDCGNVGLAQALRVWG